MDAKWRTSFKEPNQMGAMEMDTGAQVTPVTGEVLMKIERMDKLRGI